MSDLIAAARQDLLEAKRYVRPKPDVARGLVSKVQATLEGLYDEDTDIMASQVLRRLVSNLYIAGRDMLAAPSMALGYIEGALWELARIQRELEKAKESNRGQ